MIRQSRSIKNIFRRVCVLFITLVVALVFVQPGDAAYGVINRKVSGTLPDLGDVLDFKISPEGDYIVFTADQDAEGKNELFVVPRYGGVEPRRLNGELVYGGKVEYWSFQISNVTGRAVYLADQQEIGEVELYSVPLTGGDWIKLNDTLLYGGDVNAFLISPDGQYVVYWADQEVDGVYELYSVPIAGGVVPIKLNGTLQPGSYVGNNFQISPSNAWVVYQAEQDTPGVPELYRVAIGGGTSTRLNTGTLAGRQVFDFKITPNSAGVVFRCSPGTGQMELYSKYINQAGGPYKLSNIAVASGVVGLFDITPNSLGVVYSANQEVVGLSELYSNSILGGTVNMHKLSGTLPEGFNIVSDFQITSNSAGVVYKITSDVFTDMQELYANYITGGVPVKLTSTLPANLWVDQYALANNDARVVYKTGSHVGAEVGLYSVPTTGLGPSEDPIQLNGALAGGGTVHSFVLTANHFGVIYLANQDSSYHTDLYSTSTLGGIPIKVNGTLVENGNVSSTYAVTPDGKVVVYKADQEMNDKYELYISYLGWQVYLPLSTR